MSSREFAEWMAFYQLHPFGEWRSDFRMARLAATFTNVMTRTKASDPVKPEKDFIPDFEQALDEQQAAEETPPESRTWNKVKQLFGGLAKAKKTSSK
jgi:hypothetical protein